MQTRYKFNTLVLLLLLGAATAAEAQVQPELARRYFEEREWFARTNPPSGAAM
jgi:hypothetical protein